MTNTATTTKWLVGRGFVRTYITLNLVAVLLVATTVGPRTEAQDPAKADGFRCIVENGAYAAVLPGKPIAYAADRFSDNPANSLVTLDVTNGRLTGNAGSLDVKVIRDKDSTELMVGPPEISLLHHLP